VAQLHLDDFHLEELGHVEDGGQDDDRDDVVHHASPMRGALMDVIKDVNYLMIVHLDGVVVLDGLSDGQVALQGQDHGHEDGGQDGDALKLVAKKDKITYVQFTLDI